MANSPKIESKEDLQKLERQLTNSGFFNHSVLSQFAERINESEAFLFGLIDFLVDKMNFSPEELETYVAKVKRETQEKGEALHPGVALRIEDPPKDKAAFIPVNCDERMHICKGVCCKLNFALSPQEVESGLVKWELGHPYFIRHEKNGYCSHIDAEKKCCSVYENRPQVCRNYSCAKDERIWKDFDKMILNTEWIDENLAVKKARIFSITMNPKT